MQLHSTIIDNIGELCSQDWDALAGAGQPFLRHAFLEALERHGCVGKRWGWRPRHLLLHQDGRLVAAMPQYLKNNGYGELVFDWDWAEAYRRSGPVLYQGDKSGFSWPVSVQGKARLVANGIVLCKRRNAAMDADRPTLRACLWCSAPALQCLTRETAIACALRLAAKHHRHADS